MANSGTGHVHGRIAGTDDADPLSRDIIHIRIGQVIDGIGNITEGLARDQQTPGTPCTGTHEDRTIAVLEEVMDADRAADIKVGAEQDAQLPQLLAVAIQNGLRQTELRNAVAHDAAQLVAALEDRHLIASLRQNHRDGNAGRSGTDDTHLHAVGGLHLQLDPLEAGIGNVLLNGGNMHRRALDAANAVTLALLLMIADQGADDGQRIVQKEHLCSIHHSLIQETLNHLGNICMNRTALTASRLLAMQTSLRLI